MPKMVHRAVVLTPTAKYTVYRDTLQEALEEARKTVEAFHCEEMPVTKVEVQLVPDPLGELEEECEHGAGAWTCAGPNHYAEA